jgi:hypothetical protein
VSLDPLVPYDWQQADIDKCVRSMSSTVGALIVSAPGAGKTVVAVEVAKQLRPETLLIIAPPSTHRNSWQKTLERQGVTSEVRLLIGTEKGKKNFEALRWGEPGVYITSAQWFARQDWGGIEPDMVIFDEVHYVAKYGNVGNKKLLGHGSKKGLTARYRMALSGTPFRNNFENAWSIVRWVEPGKMPKPYWIWRMQDTAGKWSPFAPQNWEVTGEARPGALANSLTCYIAHAQRSACCEFHPAGFLSHLAPPIRIERDLDMTRDQAAFYRGMEKSYVAELTTPDPRTGKVPVVVEFPIAARGMLRFCALGLPSFDPESDKLYFEPDCESPKIDALTWDLGNLDGKRALILTHSRQFTDVTVHRLTQHGYRVVAWKGGVSDTKRRKIMADFLSGELDAIVGVISAMGTGTDGLQEAAYNVMWLSVDDDASNVTQGIGRLDRLGQTHQVTMIEYRMRNTFDVGHLDRQIVKQLELNKTLAKARKR